MALPEDLGPVEAAMTGRCTCSACGKPPWEDATKEERTAEPPRFCSPLRCSAWRITGRATQPHPVSGYRRMLRLVEGGEDHG